MKVIAMVANGTEECELLNVVDILRRAGVETKIVSIDGAEVVSSHGVKLIADGAVENTDLTDCDLLFIPGGMPGSERLGGNEKLIAAIDKLLKSGKRVAAICAAPALVLAAHGFLNGKKATCFPSFEDRLTGATVMGARVVTDGNITTARGLGCSLELGLEIVKLLVGKDKADEIKEKIIF